MTNGELIAIMRIRRDERYENLPFARASILVLFEKE